MIIKVNLNKALARRRMSKTELAERIQIPEVKLRLLEKVQMRDQRLLIVEKICKELDVCPEELLEFQREKVFEFEF